MSGVDGGHDANDDVESGDAVELFHGHHARSGFAIAVDVHDAVHGLNGQLRADVVFAGPESSKGADGGVDEAGVGG